LGVFTRPPSERDRLLQTVRAFVAGTSVRERKMCPAVSLSWRFLLFRVSQWMLAVMSRHQPSHGCGTSLDCCCSQRFPLRGCPKGPFLLKLSVGPTGVTGRRFQVGTSNRSCAGTVTCHVAQVPCAEAPLCSSTIAPGTQARDPRDGGASQLPPLTKAP
jgi:hypothetical protein